MTEYAGENRKETLLMEKLSQKAGKIMNERFGKDTVIALATVEDGVPYVRNVNAYYENGAFYVITYGLSNKMKQLEKNPLAAIEAAEKHTVFQVYFYNTQKIHQFRLFWWIFCDLDKISDYFKCYLCLFFVYQFNDPFEVYCKYSHRSLHLHVNEA